MFKYDPVTQTTFAYVDVENKMMLIKNHSWNPGGNGNKGDALGRSKYAFFLYEDPQFVEGAKNCWKKIECDPDYEECKWDYYYQGYRYPTPEYYTKDFSRDHTINTFCLMKLAGEDEWAKEVASHLRWVIASKHVNSKGKQFSHSHTIGLWGWLKGLFAGKWWGMPLFFLLDFIETIFYILLNKFCYLVGGISKEYHQDDYDKDTMSRQKQTKWKQFWAKATFPVYALNLSAWKLYINEISLKSRYGKFMNRLLQIMSYPLIGRHHYLHKLMFNVGKVSKSDVLGYKSMIGGRWSTPLNEINDRDVHIIKSEEWLEANVIDKDLLVKFWNIRHPEDMIVEDDCNLSAEITLS